MDSQSTRLHTNSNLRYARLMKREKTGREVLGTGLFCDPNVITRTLQALPTDAARFLRETRKEWPDASSDELRTALHSSLGIQSLEIHALLSVKIEIPRRDYLNEYRCIMSGNLAEAVVPFSGSAIFWRAQPTKSFQFGFLGRVGEATTRLRIFLDGKEFDWFEENVERELASARKALNDRSGENILIEDHAREILDRVADDVLGAL